MKYLYITIFIIIFTFIYFNNDTFVFGNDEYFNRNNDLIILEKNKDLVKQVEKSSEEIIITKINTNNSIVNNNNNSNYITKNYEKNFKEKELRNNKTIKIISEIEFDESREDRILITTEVNNDYYYNETDFYIHKNKINDGEGKKKIEINILVLKDEKMVEVCVFYYEDQHDMICKQLNIENKNVIKSKFNLESYINRYFSN